MTKVPPMSVFLRMREVLRGFVVNAHELKTEEPFRGALRGLIAMAADVLADPDGEPDVGPPEHRGACLTPSGIWRLADVLDAADPALAEELRRISERRKAEDYGARFGLPDPNVSIIGGRLTLTAHGRLAFAQRIEGDNPEAAARIRADVEERVAGAIDRLKRRTTATATFSIRPTDELGGVWRDNHV